MAYPITAGQRGPRDGVMGMILYGLMNEKIKLVSIQGKGAAEPRSDNMTFKVETDMRTQFS